MMYLPILCTCLILALGISDAVKINGEDLSINAAIAKAKNGSTQISQDPQSVLVELDILFKVDTYVKMRMEQEEAVSSSKSGRMKRKAIIPESWYRWTNKIIPYEISSQFSKRDRQVIKDALNDYHKHTCLRFVPAAPADENKVRFQNGDGCSSYVGMIGGTQPISLGRGCRYKEVVIHEVGHAIGFQHEQTRPDRDGYVSIKTENIESGMEYNFKKYTNKQVSSYGVPYDYTSIMHYDQYAFTVNEKPTIIAKDSKYQTIMGNGEGLSYRDIKLANLMYHCAASDGCEVTQCPESGFQGKDCKCWCETSDSRNPVKHCDTEPIDPSGKTCEDKIDECSSWKQFCKTDVLKPYMEENCGKTCGYC